MIAGNDRILELSIFYGMLAHSFISGGLFFIVGYIVDTTANRNIKEINSYLSVTAQSLFFILIASNAAFPFFGLFVTEVMNYTFLIHQYFLLTFVFIILSSSCFVSGLFIQSKFNSFSTGGYGNIRSISTVQDSLLVVVLCPVVLFSLAFGFQVILPISLINFFGF